MCSAIHKEWHFSQGSRVQACASCAPWAPYWRTRAPTGSATPATCTPARNEHRSARAARLAVAAQALRLLRASLLTAPAFACLLVPGAARPTDCLQCSTANRSGGPRDHLTMGWSELPYDVMRAVFCRLDMRSLHSCSRVCARWRRITKESDVWRQAFLMRFGVPCDELVADKDWRERSQLRCEQLKALSSILTFNAEQLHHASENAENILSSIVAFSNDQESFATLQKMHCLNAQGILSHLNGALSSLQPDNTNVLNLYIQALLSLVRHERRVLFRQFLSQSDFDARQDSRAASRFHSFTASSALAVVLERSARSLSSFSTALANQQSAVQVTGIGCEYEFPHFPAIMRDVACLILLVHTEKADIARVLHRLELACGLLLFRKRLRAQTPPISRPAPGHPSCPDEVRDVLRKTVLPCGRLPPDFKVDGARVDVSADGVHPDLTAIPLEKLRQALPVSIENARAMEPYAGDYEGMIVLYLPYMRDAVIAPWTMSVHVEPHRRGERDGTNLGDSADAGHADGDGADAHETRKRRRTHQGAPAPDFLFDIRASGRDQTGISYDMKGLFDSTLKAGCLSMRFMGSSVVSCAVFGDAQSGALYGSFGAAFANGAFFLALSNA